MFFNFLLEKFGIDFWFERKEWLTKTGAESGLGLGDSGFSSGNLGSVSVEEVLHGLFGGELADRREDSESIGGEEDDVFGMSANTGNARAIDEFDWVRAAGVFGDRFVIVIGGVIFVEIDVFEHRSEPDCVEDLWFFFFGEVDTFSVASTFKVEDSGVGPTVLIVADEVAIWVGGDGCFSGSGEPKEEGGIAGFANVCRAVHAHHIF